MSKRHVLTSEDRTKGGKVSSKQSSYFGKGHLPTSKNKGRKFSKSWRDNLSKSHKGQVSANKGKKFTQQEKDKVSKGVLKNYSEHPELKSILREKRLQQKPFMRDTLIELSLQSELTKRSIKFITQKSIDICQVDIYIPLLNTVIFADGCYWHGCEKCYPKPYNIVRTVSPAQMRQRDKKITSYLKNKGYRVYRFWEHDINASPAACIDMLLNI